jgi:hypothetical protein
LQHIQISDQMEVGMTVLPLLASTGSDRADAILSGAVHLWEALFPERIRGYYLSGSYATATATPTSDLDLTIVFKDDYHNPAESDRAQQLCAAIEALHPAIFLDLGYLSEQSLQQADRVSVALQLKMSSRLIYGEDIRDQITAIPDARYVRDAMHIPYFASRYGRPQLTVLPFPLDYPDPNGRFYGYDGWNLSSSGDTEQAGTKMLVVIVGRIASALVALHSGAYVSTKHESVTLYRKHIHDQWADLVEQVYDMCKVRWQYRVPTNPSDQAQLQALCRRALDFENHFFAQYRSYLLDELHTSAREDQLRAVERLGQIIYPGEAIDKALTQLLEGADGDLRTAIAQTMQQRASAHIEHLRQHNAPEEQSAG